jgi:hypothetical protein
VRVDRTAVFAAGFRAAVFLAAGFLAAVFRAAGFRAALFLADLPDALRVDLRAGAVFRARVLFLAITLPLFVSVA